MRSRFDATTITTGVIDPRLGRGVSEPSDISAALPATATSADGLRASLRAGARLVIPTCDHER